MRKWQQPAEYKGKYPEGWAGFTWLDEDPNYNVFHPGEDLNWTATGGGNEDLGRDVWAIQAGKVVYASFANWGYGNMIVIEHTLDADERALVKKLYNFDVPVIYSLYAHLNSINVSNGATVKMGQKIGTIGDSGTAWAHLHYEISVPDDLDWRFYPTGWTKEQIKTKYIPAFNFIEATKIIISPTPPMDKRLAQFDKVCVEINKAGYSPTSAHEWYFDNPVDPDKFTNMIKRIITDAKVNSTALAKAKEEGRKLGVKSVDDAVHKLL